MQICEIAVDLAHRECQLKGMDRDIFGLLFFPTTGEELTKNLRFTVSLPGRGSLFVPIENLLPSGPLASAREFFERVYGSIDEYFYRRDWD